jgi:hypothetical protein
MSRIVVTKDVIARRKLVHQYLINSKAPLICKAIACALDIKPQTVAADLRFLESHGMAVSIGKQRLKYENCKGTTLVETYKAGSVKNESLYAKNLKYGPRSAKPNIMYKADETTDEPDGRWKTIIVNPGHTIYRAGSELKIRGGQCAV